MAGKLNILENETIEVLENKLESLYKQKSIIDLEIVLHKKQLESELRKAEKEQGKKFCSPAWMLTRSERKQVNKISIAKLKMYVTDEIIKRCQTTTWQNVQGLIKKPK
jgi:hypothetical protein